MERNPCEPVDERRSPPLPRHERQVEGGDVQRRITGRAVAVPGPGAARRPGVRLPARRRARERQRELRRARPPQPDGRRRAPRPRVAGRQGAAAVPARSGVRRGVLRMSVRAGRGGSGLPAAVAVPRPIPGAGPRDRGRREAGSRPEHERDDGTVGAGGDRRERAAPHAFLVRAAGWRPRGLGRDRHARRVGPAGMARPQGDPAHVGLSAIHLRLGGVEKTTSGKVQRFACRDALLAGTLDALAIWRQPPPREARTAPAAAHAVELAGGGARELACP